MKELLSKISSLLKENENDNSWSTVRFAMLFTVIISNIAFFGIWITLCIKTRTVLDVPTNVVTLYSLANGVSVGAKVLQKKFENKALTVEDPADKVGA